MKKLLFGVLLTGCAATHPTMATRTGVAAQLPASKWYSVDMAATMANEKANCPTIPLGCFAKPPDCLIELCYCPKVCEPKLWLTQPGVLNMSPSGTTAGRGQSCKCAP